MKQGCKLEREEFLFCVKATHVNQVPDPSVLITTKAADKQPNQK